MNYSISTLTVFFILTLFCSGSCFADVSLPGFFSDNMIFQQGKKLPVWGSAEKGENIKVEFAGSMQETTADNEGKWIVELPAQKASFEPRSMVVNGNNKIEIKNILVGEVWLTSGQSNMYWTVARSANAGAEIKAADHPDIRIFHVDFAADSKPRSDMPHNWRVCSPETIKDFSAVSYYFARKLQEKLKVPVGIIHSSVRGTSIEAWMTKDAIAEADAFTGI
ncbi:MAG: sialate O-acetylesterase, partial [Planctomycetota bacterium]